MAEGLDSVHGNVAEAIRPGSGPAMCPSGVRSTCPNTRPFLFLIPFILLILSNLFSFRFSSVLFCPVRRQVHPGRGKHPAGVRQRQDRPVRPGPSDVRLDDGQGGHRRHRSRVPQNRQAEGDQDKVKGSVAQKQSDRACDLKATGPPPCDGGPGQQCAPGSRSTVRPGPRRDPQHLAGGRAKRGPRKRSSLLQSPNGVIDVLTPSGIARRNRPDASPEATATHHVSSLSCNAPIAPQRTLPPARRRCARQ